MKASIILLLFGWVASISAQQCCPNGEIIRPRGYCGVGNYSERINIDCPFGTMLLKNVIVKGNKVTTADTPNYVFVEDPNQYCLGQMYVNPNGTSQDKIDVALVCFQESLRSNELETSGILTLISVVFLALTFAVYMYLPQMRDLQGLCYICLCVSMALGYLSLGVLQLSPGFKGEICTVTGFLVYFWMMATFFWMNVISINVYRNVLDASYLKKTETKQYFLYSCYAWGSTLFFLIVSMIANFVDGDHLKPGFGNGSCWFSGATETWLFFYGPIAILITANVTLFIMASFQLWKQDKQYEVNVLNNLRHKFLLSLKLFLVMGISWIFEIASFAHGEKLIIWKIMDTFNCLQGVVIFILLVILRRRAMQGLASEGCCLRITRPLSEALSPHDSDIQHIMADDHMEVRLN